MRRFILKKDLPTFKAGDEFYLGESGHLFAKCADGGQDIIAYRNETLAKFPSILKEWFEEIPEEPETVDDLKAGDKCYIAVTQKYGLYIIPATFCEELDHLRSVGGCFLTLDDGLKALKKARAEVILRRDTKGFKPTFRHQGTCVYYDHERNRLDYSDCIYADGTIRFANHSDVRASIKAHPNEWLAYLGVEEEE